MIHAISTPNAPAAIGPYSQAVRAGNLVFLSGQLGINPETGEFSDETAAGQTGQIFENIRAVLDAAHSSLEQVVKTTVFLADIDDFAAVNEVYARHFSKPYPARSAFAVKALPKNARVEIELIATLKEI